MVIEYIRYDVPEAQREGFVAAYDSAATELSASPHCLRYEISQGVEEPQHFTVRTSKASARAPSSAASSRR
jgi:quinol monooxygenase YgiN